MHSTLYLCTSHVVSVVLYALRRQNNLSAQHYSCDTFATVDFDFFFQQPDHIGKGKEAKDVVM